MSKIIYATPASWGDCYQSKKDITSDSDFYKYALPSIVGVESNIPGKKWRNKDVYDTVIRIGSWDNVLDNDTNMVTLSADGVLLDPEIFILLSDGVALICGAFIGGQLSLISSDNGVSEEEITKFIKQLS